MLDERFIVDDAGFEFRDEHAAALEATLLRFLHLLEYAQSTSGGVARWSEIWSIQASSGRTLSELLYSTSEVDRDVRLLTGGRLDKLRCWDEDDALNPPIEVSCGNQMLTLSPGVALCASAHGQNRGVGALTTEQAGRRGPVEVVFDESMPAPVCFLVDDSDGPTFWRSTIDLENLDADGVAAIAPLAFPMLRFAPDTWRQVGRFEGAFRDLRGKLVRDLAGLDDHGLEVWRLFAEPARISAEMASRAAVDCSPDSPQTHRNAAATAERDIEFEGRTVRCEWHTKLEPHRNRVHFAVLDKYVLVGVFAAHLTT
jgi:hypothetical protein